MPDRTEFSRRTAHGEAPFLNETRPLAGHGQPAYREFEQAAVTADQVTPVAD